MCKEGELFAMELQGEYRGPGAAVFESSFKIVKVKLQKIDNFRDSSQEISSYEKLMFSGFWMDVGQPKDFVGQPKTFCCQP